VLAARLGLMPLGPVHNHGLDAPFSER
jgi:hypothetical protein